MRKSSMKKSGMPIVTGARAPNASPAGATVGERSMLRGADALIGGCGLRCVSPSARRRLRAGRSVGRGRRRP